MSRRRFPALLVLMAPVAPAAGDILGTHDPARPAHEWMAHVNVPGGMAHGEEWNTPISAPPFDFLSVPWELDVADFGVPPRHGGAMARELTSWDSAAGVGAPPPASTPIPAPGVLAAVGLGAAALAGRGGRARPGW